MGYILNGSRGSVDMVRQLNGIPLRVVLTDTQTYFDFPELT